MFLLKNQKVCLGPFFLSLFLIYGNWVFSEETESSFVSSEQVYENNAEMQRSPQSLEKDIFMYRVIFSGVFRLFDFIKIRKIFQTVPEGFRKVLEVKVQKEEVVFKLWTSFDQERVEFLLKKLFQTYMNKLTYDAEEKVFKIVWKK